MNTEDTVWKQLRKEAQQAADNEPVLRELIETSILNCASLEESLAHRVSRKLGHLAISEPYLHDLFIETFMSEPQIGVQVRRDIIAVDQRDPASQGFLSPVLYFKGFLALTAYRIAHALWQRGRREIALYLQHVISQVFAVDIHPAAKIGSGILLDHATGIVIGETAVVEDDVSILHEVTLGGTGKDRGDRHPKVRRGVLLSAGCKVLGNVEIGQCAKVAAGSVVLSDVPAFATVAGIPAKIVRRAEESTPAECMDHQL